MSLSTPLRGIGIASNTPYVEDPKLVIDEARHVEALGFATLWRSGVLPMVEVAVRATSHIPVATGIIPVSTVAATDVVQTYRALHSEHRGRFIVGLGGARDAHPLRTLGAYLDELDGAGVTVTERMMAALGPNMLALARERTSGAYPYLVTTSFVTSARALLGSDHVLAVLLMTIPTTDRELARRVAADRLGFMTQQGGYRNNLLRLGFSPEDIDGVSDRLLDGITAWGDEERIAARIAEYHTAGADQVVLRVLDVGDDEYQCRERLANALLS